MNAVLGLGKWTGFSATPAAEAEPSAGPAVDSAWEKVKLWGLTNTGNTCYANSVLQALYFCEPFRLAVQAGRRPSSAASPSTAWSIDASIPAPHVSATSADPVATPKVNGKALAPDGKQGKASGSSAARPNAPTNHRRTSSVASSVGHMALGAPMGVPDGEAKPNGAAVNGTTTPNGGASTRGNSPERAAEETLLSTLRDLFCAISFHPKRSGVVAPHAFINQLRKQNELFRSTMHQDAHEFLNYLLNEIAEELEKDLPPPSATKPTHTSEPIPTAPRTWIHSLFEGILTNQTRCLTCETVTSRDESFLDLSIDIEDNSSVSACLRQFSASEMLAHKNKFSCDTCCGLQEAEKRMVVKKMPRILALHLKRFKYQEDLQRFTKLAYRVAFPAELRLFNTIPAAQPDPDLLYSLWAVVVHIGVGPHAGHYITLLRSHGRWLCFDDETVTEVNQSELLKYFGDTPNAGSGYVLFYEAVEVDRPGRTLAHLAHDLTPAQAALLDPRPLYDPEEELVAPLSPSGSSAAPASERGSLASPTFAIVSPAPHTDAAIKEAGLKGFFGLGRKGAAAPIVGGGGEEASTSQSTLMSTEATVPTAHSSPASRKMSLPLNDGTPPTGSTALPPTDSDTASTTSSHPSHSPMPASAQGPVSSSGKPGLFGRGFLSRTKSMRRPVSGSGLSLDTDVAAAPSAASAPPIPHNGSALPEPPTSPRKEKRRGLFGSKN